MVLSDIERYFDAAPRPLATTEEIGPFTVFVNHDPSGWPYYARPRLGGTAAFRSDHVTAVLRRQRELGVPARIEWVDEVTPGLQPAVREAGWSVHRCPLLTLPAGAERPPLRPPARVRVETIPADAPDLGRITAAIKAGFDDTDDWSDAGPGPWPRLLAEGLSTMVGAFDAVGPVGGGSHSPRGTTTELTGIAVIPRARRFGIGAAITATLVDDAKDQGVRTIFMSASDDAVARVYERVGFVRVGTACIASGP